MKIKYLMCFAMLLLAAVGVQAAEFKYDFDGLVDGAIDGQDNWVNISSLNNGTIATTDGSITGLSGQYYESVGTDSQFARVNDDNWSYSLTDTSIVELSVVMRINGGSYFSFVGIRDDAAGNGWITTFGVRYSDFCVRESYADDSSPEIKVAHGITTDSMVKLTMEIDPTGNGGEGSGTLYYENLTTGGAKTVVGGDLENMNMGLTAGFELSDADAIYIRAHGNGPRCEDISIVQDTNMAYGPDPANNSNLVAIDKQLSWVAPDTYTPASYTLEIRVDDPNFALAGTITDAAATSPFNPGELAYDTTYYWRVTAYNGGTANVGRTWKFTTAPSVPVIQEQPVKVTVAAGTEATLTVAGLNITGYQWYKEAQTGDVMLSGKTDSSLVITETQLSDEGIYYCIVSNGNLADDVETDHVLIMTERAIAKWAFDNDDLTDSVGDFDAAAGLTPIFTFTTGMVNNAINFDGAADPNNIVAINNTPILNSESFTVSAWARADGGADTYRAVVSNRNAPTGTSDGYVIYAQSNNQWAFWFGTTNGWVYLNGPAVVENEWILLTATYDSETKEIQFFVNGVASSGGTLNDGLNYQPNTVNELRIGAGDNKSADGNFFFNGLIDEVQCWNYALDKVTVAHLYADVTGEDVCTGDVQYDYTGDCIVNLADFAVFASAWLDNNIVAPAN